ncbi:hypothetical protein LTR27_002882 [Elasticomyces elasticus]|nr:hypothetical protein LTR27_002882 [Elasticomyces elasticus]
MHRVGDTDDAHEMKSTEEMRATITVTATPGQTPSPSITDGSAVALSSSTRGISSAATTMFPIPGKELLQPLTPTGSGTGIEEEAMEQPASHEQTQQEVLESGTKAAKGRKDDTVKTSAQSVAAKVVAKAELPLPTKKIRPVLIRRLDLGEAIVLNEGPGCLQISRTVATLEAYATRLFNHDPVRDRISDVYQIHGEQRTSMESDKQYLTLFDGATGDMVFEFEHTHTTPDGLREGHELPGQYPTPATRFDRFVVHERHLHREPHVIDILINKFRENSGSDMRRSAPETVESRT